MQKQNEVKVPDKPMSVDYFNTQMDVINQTKALIAPDPEYARNCKMAGCHGSRGWYGINTIRQPDGSLHMQLLVCCGRVGISDHARLETLINTRVQQLQDSVEARGRVTSDVLLNVQKDLSVTVGKVVAIKHAVEAVMDEQGKNVESFDTLRKQVASVGEIASCVNGDTSAIRSVTDSIAQPLHKRVWQAIRGRKVV